MTKTSIMDEKFKGRDCWAVKSTLLLQRNQLQFPASQGCPQAAITPGPGEAMASSNQGCQVGTWYVSHIYMQVKHSYI